MVISFLSLQKITGVQLKKWVCHAEVLNVFMVENPIFGHLEPWLFFKKQVPVSFNKLGNICDDISDHF